MTKPAGRFHLAIPVDDLERAVGFYAGLLGCAIGRRAETWVDFFFFGHQLSCHLAPGPREAEGRVDGRRVPVPHFGVILPRAAWEGLADRIRAAGHPFLAAPAVRYAGRAAEQGTFFVADPAGNALEFKYFADERAIFAAFEEDTAEEGRVS